MPTISLQSLTKLHVINGLLSSHSDECLDRGCPICKANIKVMEVIHSAKMDDSEEAKILRQWFVDAREYLADQYNECVGDGAILVTLCHDIGGIARREESLQPRITDYAKGKRDAEARKAKESNG